MENRITIKIFEYAYSKLPLLAKLLAKEKGIPVSQIAAASVAIEEALEKRQLHTDIIADSEKQAGS